MYLLLMLVSREGQAFSQPKIKLNCVGKGKTIYCRELVNENIRGKLFHKKRALNRNCNAPWQMQILMAMRI